MIPTDAVKSVGYHALNLDRKRNKFASDEACENRVLESTRN